MPAMAGWHPAMPNRYVFTIHGAGFMHAKTLLIMKQ